MRADPRTRLPVASAIRHRLGSGGGGKRPHRIRLRSLRGPGGPQPRGAARPSAILIGRRPTVAAMPATTLPDTPAIRVAHLSCGLPVLLETMPSVASVAAAWLLPLGDAGDPEARQGEAAMLSELALRGAGGRDSRLFSDDLDRLGVQRSLSNSARHLRLSATMTGDRLSEALPILADLVLRPRLPQDALEPVRQLCLQSLESLQDDPQRRVMLALAERHHPPPFNRSGLGIASHLEAISIEHLRERWQRDARPGGGVLAIAGRVDPDAVLAQLESLLAGWSGEAAEPQPAAAPQRGRIHLPQESSQVHLGIALDAPPQRNPESILHVVAARILGGGPSSRLFVELREKRGLCYSVGASCSLGRDRGATTIYLGSTPQRVGEGRKLLLEGLAELARGVSEAEFQRVSIGLRTAMVMQGESSAARASQLALDHDRLGRPRTLPEMEAEVAAVSRGRLEEFVAQRLGPAWRSDRSEASLGPGTEPPGSPAP